MRCVSGELSMEELQEGGQYLPLTLLGGGSFSQPPTRDPSPE